ncbi:hypothetical protein Shyhy02_62490 [Streptomyces hygroscopicus subsp. hygroscopicus]|nr:hypothetical protein Shyhy02_62490 [Streptomyces hygroscopicus subsp. hygroscopicus]
MLLERADRLVAVWNRQPPTGNGGGTADVVHQARRQASLWMSSGRTGHPAGRDECPLRPGGSEGSLHHE